MLQISEVSSRQILISISGVQRLVGRTAIFGRPSEVTRFSFSSSWVDKASWLGWFASGYKWFDFSKDKRFQHVGIALFLGSGYLKSYS